MKNTLRLTLASVAACSAITFGAATASAAPMTLIQAVNDFLLNATVNDSDTTSGCSVNWTTYEGHTKGACFFVDLLKRGNGHASDYTAVDTLSMWGKSSPTSHDFFVMVNSAPAPGGAAPSPERYFRKITSVTQLAAGDVMVIDSRPAPATYAGHLMVVTGPAQLLPSQASQAGAVGPFWLGTIQWAVPIVDSTAAKHGCNVSYPDSRWFGDCSSGFPVNNGEGVGTGIIRVYTDLATGQVIGHTWSVSNGDPSIVYFSQNRRPFRFGRLISPLPPPQSAPPPPPPPPPSAGAPV